jgi:hypothetical protein
MRHALVILENGSRWPNWLDSQELDTVELVAQRPGETLPQLARRIIERLANDASFSTATLVCSPLGGEERHQSRAVLLRALLGAAARAGGGDVILAADGTAAQRRGLVELAAQLNSEIHDEPEVSLRFRAVPRESHLRVA